MTDSTVKFSALKKGDRFRREGETRVYYKAYYSPCRRLWFCLYDDGSRRQARFSADERVIFVRHA